MTYHMTPTQVSRLRSGQAVEVPVDVPTDITISELDDLILNPKPVKYNGFKVYVTGYVWKMLSDKVSMSIMLAKDFEELNYETTDESEDMTEQEAVASAQQMKHEMEHDAEHLHQALDNLAVDFLRKKGFDDFADEYEAVLDMYYA